MTEEEYLIELKKKSLSYGEVMMLIPPPVEINGRIYNNPKIRVDVHNDLWIPLTISDCMLILLNRGENI